ncbi:MAG: HD domain-containing protein [Acidobacteriota bacterium]
MLSLRDPVHGFIRADSLEAALIDSAPLQRLRSIRQLGLTHLVFPGAEHSRFSHALGAMELAGRAYDSLAAKSGGRLPESRTCRERRLVRAAALLHDIGHAPFSHSAEELFEEGIDHEEMTRRLLRLDELQVPFERHGDGLTAADVDELLAGRGDPLLGQIISGELDVDKMDYLLRDSLFCGVR